LEKDRVGAVFKGRVASGKTKIREPQFYDMTTIRQTVAWTRPYGLSVNIPAVIATPKAVAIHDFFYGSPPWIAALRSQ
jgi:hypothetical protein